MQLGIYSLKILKWKFFKDYEVSEYKDTVQLLDGNYSNAL